MIFFSLPVPCAEGDDADDCDQDRCRSCRIFTYRVGHRLDQFVDLALRLDFALFTAALALSAALRLINLFMVVVIRSLRCGRIFLDLLRRGLLFSRYCGRRLRCYTWCYICAGSGAAVRIVTFVSGFSGSVSLLSALSVAALVSVALAVSGSASVAVARFISGSVTAACAASASGSASGGRGTAVYRYRSLPNLY